MSEKERCGNCKFLPDHTEYGGNCLRLPPRPLIYMHPVHQEIIYESCFPGVGVNEWCGEWSVIRIDKVDQLA